MLLGHTDVGCDLAPRLNGRLGGGLAMDCMTLSVDPATKLLVSTRPVFGGNAHATMVSKGARPQMATVRPKTMPPAERNDSRQGQVIPVEGKIDASALKVKVIDRIKEEVEGIKLEDAEVVVSVIDLRSLPSWNDCARPGTIFMSASKSSSRSNRHSAAS